MSTIEQLLKPILGSGIRTVNFFNGRLLSGEDLSAEQEAQRQGRRLLGQATGEGIAHGLEVAEARGLSTLSSPVVTVEAGLAVSRAGQLLKLKDRTNVALKQQSSASGAAAAAQTSETFKDCQPLQPGGYIVGESVYLLTLAPAEGREGRAPASGFGDLPITCNTRYTVEGVQFRLIELLTPEQIGNLRSLRNRVAYQCFGVEETQSYQRNPFGPSLKGYGLLDDYRPDVLTDCEVPLALMYWTAGRGLEFVDLWSVRRRLTAQSFGGGLELLFGDRRASEGEAMLLQFQQQVSELFAAAEPQTVVASEHFQYLPPVGVLPVGAGGFKGFDLNTFFGGRVLGQPEYVDNAYVLSLFRDSLDHEPLNLSRGEPVRLYKTWLSAPIIVEGRPVQPSVVYASPYMTHLAAARFDVARWDGATYVLSDD